MTISRYPLKIVLSQVVTMPAGGAPLFIRQFGMNGCGPIYLYALVDETVQTTAQHTVKAYTTGQVLDPSPGTYVGSLQVKGSPDCFHVYVT